MIVWCECCEFGVNLCEFVCTECVFGVILWWSFRVFFGDLGGRGGVSVFGRFFDFLVFFDDFVISYVVSSFGDSLVMMIIVVSLWNFFFFLMMIEWVVVAFERECHWVVVRIFFSFMYSY